MFSYALTLTANKDDAYDLLQDTTLKVLDNQDKYTDDVNFKGWVMTIMRNIFINNHRKMVRNQMVLDSDEKDFYLNTYQDPVSDTPETDISCKEISAMITDLSPELRNPLVMHISGYRYDEIAEVLDIPKGTVKSRIYYARQKLQKKLDAKN